MIKSDTTMLKMKTTGINIFAIVAMTLSISPIRAQQPSAPNMSPIEMGGMPGMDHSQMNHDTESNIDQGEVPVIGQDTGHAAHDMNNTRSSAMDSGGMSMQGGTAPADARDPHAYSDGYDFGDIPRPVFVDEHSITSVRVDRLESVVTDSDTIATYDLQAQFGRDYNRMAIKAEGDLDEGKLEESSTELLWEHAVAAFWDTQLGIRHDTGEGPNRTWLAFGLQGLAPYWFEIDATAYLNEKGRTALNIEADYELLLTQKLILQPRIELNVYGKRDPERGLGRGISDLSAGLRLRYEFRREFAPYLGVEWAGRFGGTKDFARVAGDDPNEIRFVAGFRFWF